MDQTALLARAGYLTEDTGHVQWSSALKLAFLNDGARDFARATKCYKKASGYLSADASPADSLANAYTFYVLPTDLLELESVWFNGDLVPLVSAAELGSGYEDVSGESPIAATMDDSLTEIRMYPAPSAALTTLRVRYAAIPAEMNGTTVTEPTGIPVPSRIALVYYCVAMCYLRNGEEGDPAKAAQYMAMYQREVDDLTARVARRFHSGGARTRYGNV